MARTFSMATTADPSSLLVRAKKAASENGATLRGDERSGRFSHEMVRGEYRMVGQKVTVTIIDKHLLIPWPVVASQLSPSLCIRTEATLPWPLILPNSACTSLTQ